MYKLFKEHYLSKLMLYFLIFILCAPLASAGLTISDEANGFTLELPDGFVAQPDHVQEQAGIIHAFELGDPADDQSDIILLIKKLPGTIGREPLEMSMMPPGFQGSLFKAQWQGFEVDGFEVPEIAGDVPTVTFNVQIPLKRAAIQIMLYGEADRDTELKQLLPQILSGLSGQSSWSASTATSPVVSAPTVHSENPYRIVLIVVAVIIVVGGLVLFWLISKRAPRGTVLVMAVVIYVIGITVAGSRVRELLLIGGSLQLLGFSGGILGIVDALRKRKP